MLPLVSTALRRIAASAAAWRRAQQDRQQLMAMDDAELRDLGIGRGQIPHVLGAAPSQHASWHAAVPPEGWAQALEQKTT